MNGGNVYMDKVYMVLLFFMIVPMLICIKYTCKVKGRSYSGYGSGCSASIIENGWKIEY